MRKKGNKEWDSWSLPDNNSRDDELKFIVETRLQPKLILHKVSRSTLSCKKNIVIIIDEETALKGGVLPISKRSM